MNGGFEIKLPERAGSIADMWANRVEEAKKLTVEEAQKYGDIIIGDYQDNYVNLTYKLLTGHRWASAFCQGMFIFQFSRFLKIKTPLPVD